MSEELKPCPIDECKAVIIGTGHRVYAKYNKFQILAECGLSTKWFNTSEEAITAWNRRQSERLMPITEENVFSLLVENRHNIVDIDGRIHNTALSRLICDRFGTPKVESERGGE